MTRRITFVIEHAEDQSWVKTTWQPERLAKELVEAGATEASMFIGRLEDAPESWAYVLATSEGDLAERAKQPAIRDRLGKTIGTTTNPLAACKLAEDAGLVGVLEDSSTWFVRASDKEPQSSLGVRRTIAAKLGWHVWSINSTATYALTKSIAMPLPKLIVGYLEAALGR